MNRRTFIGLLASTTSALPFGARAQRSAIPVIGFLSGQSPGPWAPYVAAFRSGLNETGYFEDKNVAIEFRWAEGRDDRLPALAADLVRRQSLSCSSGAAEFGKPRQRLRPYQSCLRRETIPSTPALSQSGASGW